jgi:hypothetical protein
MMLKPDGQRAWQIHLDGGAGLAGAPAVRGEDVWVIGRDGQLHALAVADGSSRLRRALRLLPAGGVATIADLQAVPVSRSTVRPLLSDPSAKGSRRASLAP